MGCRTFARAESARVAVVKRRERYAVFTTVSEDINTDVSWWNAVKLEKSVSGAGRETMVDSELSSATV